MGLFNAKNTPAGPYRDSATNKIYNLLFCDNPALYEAGMQPPYSYPFDILFAEKSNAIDLQKIIDDDAADPRVSVLACRRLMSEGIKPAGKEIFAVIIEVGLDEGLDVLASFRNGTARYINQTGQMLIWETTDERSGELTRDLFSKSRQVVDRIGPWDEPRRPSPPKGNVRLSFLVSDGLYFGEGPVNVLFSDPLAGPALATATQLMQYLTEKSLDAR